MKIGARVKDRPVVLRASDEGGEGEETENGACSLIYTDSAVYMSNGISH